MMNEDKRNFRKHKPETSRSIVEALFRRENIVTVGDKIYRIEKVRSGDSKPCVRQ